MATDDRPEAAASAPPDELMASLGQLACHCSLSPIIPTDTREGARGRVLVVLPKSPAIRDQCYVKQNVGLFLAQYTGRYMPPTSLEGFLEAKEARVLVWAGDLFPAAYIPITAQICRTGAFHPLFFFTVTPPSSAVHSGRRWDETCTIEAQL